MAQMGKEENERSSQAATFTFPVRYYHRRCALFDDPVPARGYRGYAEKRLTVNAIETVVACMHVSNLGYPGGLQWSADSPDAAITGSIESIPRMKYITDNHIAPLLDAARGIGMRVIYLMSGSEKWAENYPQYRELAARVEEPASPTADLPRCPRDYREEFLRDVLGDEYLAMSEGRMSTGSVAPSVEPQPQDWIITTLKQAATLLSENGILNVLFTGFDASGCLLTSAGGVYDMGALGYRCVVLRDCTTAGESAETAPDLTVTKSILTVIELFRAYTADSKDVIAAIEAAL